MKLQWHWQDKRFHDILEAGPYRVWQSMHHRRLWYLYRNDKLIAYTDSQRFCKRLAQGDAAEKGEGQHE